MGITFRPTRSYALLAISLAAAIGGLSQDAHAGAIAPMWVFPKVASAHSSRWVRVHLNWDPKTQIVDALYLYGYMTLTPGLLARDPQHAIDASTYVLWDQNGPAPFVTYDHPDGTNDWWLTFGPFCSYGIDNKPVDDWPYVVGWLDGPGSGTSRGANTVQYGLSAVGYFLNYTANPPALQDPAPSVLYYYGTVSDNDDCLQWTSGLAGGVNPLTVDPPETATNKGTGSSKYTFRVMYRSGFYSGLDMQPRCRYAAASTNNNNGGGGLGGEFYEPSIGSGESVLDRNGGHGHFPDLSNGGNNGTNPTAPIWRAEPRDLGEGGPISWLANRTADPWLDQTGYRRSEGDARGGIEPHVLLVVDGQTNRAHYMLPESPDAYNNPDTFRWSNGCVFQYNILPTDYARFFDNLLLFPYDSPGGDLADAYPTRIHGRPSSNNYVALTAGRHTYEFWASDDFLPTRNRAWTQVGWPGNDAHVEHVRLGLPTLPGTPGLDATNNVDPALASSRGFRYDFPTTFLPLTRSGGGTPDSGNGTPLDYRFGDTSPGQPDPFGYNFPSHAAPSQGIPQPTLEANPVLTAAPFFGVSGIEGGIGDGHNLGLDGFMEQQLNLDNLLALSPSDSGVLPNPFTADPGTVGPNPPRFYTNDDTILPNWANIYRGDEAAPFRGGKWTKSTVFTFRVNYWQSDNLEPRSMYVHILKTKNGAPPDITATPISLWPKFPMGKHNPAASNFAGGVVYEYQASASQIAALNGASGAPEGDFYYAFEAYDGNRTTYYPQRPSRTTDLIDGRTYNDPGQWPGVPGTSNTNDYNAPYYANASGQGQPYYWFRVNHAPVLSNQAVSPPSGRVGANYKFTVTYTDADGQVNGNSLTPPAPPHGDRPFKAKIRVDVFGDPKGQMSVDTQNGAVPITATTLPYTTTITPLFADHALDGKLLLVQDGAAAGKRYTIVSNINNIITIIPVGGGTLLTDGVSTGNKLHVLDWREFDMTPDPTQPSQTPTQGWTFSQLDFTKGVVYAFSSATNVQLQPGKHYYYFDFVDNWGDWAYQGDPNVNVEGEEVRFPLAREFEGPEVLQQTAPYLRDFRFTPQAADPANNDGSTNSKFVFYVTYVSDQNAPPAYVLLGLDPDPRVTGNPAIDPSTPPSKVITMTQLSPGAVYRDGAVFKSDPLQLTEGAWIIRGQTSDGNQFYPPFVQPGTAPFSGPQFSDVANPPPSRYSAPSAIPQDGAPVRYRYAPGPHVARNNPPVLSVPADDTVKDLINGLSPTAGRDTRTTEYVYTVYYRDPDVYPGTRGDPPSYVKVSIDGVTYDMTIDPTAGASPDYASGNNGKGVKYTFSTKTPGAQGFPGLFEGHHSYYFIASDGMDTARLPDLSQQPSNVFDGPWVQEPPPAPTDFQAVDTPADQGGSVDLSWTASLNDGGGQRNVVEYHVYRRLGSSGASGAYTSKPILVIPATGAGAYTAKDNPTFNLVLPPSPYAPPITNTDYYYAVAAYIAPAGSSIVRDPVTHLYPDLTAQQKTDLQSTLVEFQGKVRPLDNIPPGPPTNLTVTPAAAGGWLSISWDKSPDDGQGVNDVIGYKLLRSTDPTTFGGQIATTLKGVTTYQDKTVKAGTTYYYFVKAYDSGGDSDTDPDDPPGIAATPTDTNPPAITPTGPVDGQTGVDPRPTILFRLEDYANLVDFNSLTMTVSSPSVAGGLAATVPLTLISHTPAGTVKNPGNQLLATRFDCSFPMPAAAPDYPQSADVTINLTVKNAVGNSSTLSYTFTIKSPPTFTISGQVVDAATPTLGVDGVTITPTGGYPPVITPTTPGQPGVFSLPGFLAGTYTLTPSKAGKAFTPTTATVTVGTGITTPQVIFQAANGYIISGTVIGPNPDGTPGTIPLQGITVSAGGYSTTTAGDGTYALPPLVASTYLVTAADPNAQYATMTASVPLTTADAVANFTLPFKTYTLSGTLRDSTGHGVPSITVTATLAGSTDPPHTTLSGANGVYTFSGANGLRRGQYTITPDPAQWAWKPSSTNVNLAADTAGIDFAGARLYTVVMPTGLSLIGLPLEPTSVNPETAFGVGAAIARYDPTAAATQQPYAIYVAPLPGQPPVVPSILEVHAGRGFWVRQPQQGTDTTRTINVPGVLTPDIPFNLSLAAGWNMVANPFAHDIPWSFTQIATGGSVRDYAYVYSQALGYQLVTRTVLPGALSVLPQNAGMWMRASAATTVRVTALVGQSSASDTAPVAAKREAGDYAIQISATCGGLRDQSAVAGIMKAAGADGYRFEKPPAIGPAVNVFFPSDAGTRLGTDVRGSGTGAQTWNFTVAVDTPNAPVTVGLPDLSTVPNNLRVTLTDVDAGKTVYARTMSGYTYNSGEGGDRHFTLTVAPATAGGLVVTAASAQQVSGGAQIVYTLSRPASVTVSIMNIAGRTVRTLGAGSVQTAGVNVANWNLRSDAGASVPAGRYLVQIQAVADDGQKVQALSQLNVAK